MKDLKSSMDSREFAEWIEFYKIHPFGETRADFRNAMVCALLANANRDPKSQPVEMEAFMVDFTKQKNKMTDSQISNKVLGILKTFQFLTRGKRSK